MVNQFLIVSLCLLAILALLVIYDIFAMRHNAKLAAARDICKEVEDAFRTVDPTAEVSECEFIGGTLSVIVGSRSSGPLSPSSLATIESLIASNINMKPTDQREESVDKEAALR